MLRTRVLTGVGLAIVVAAAVLCLQTRYAALVLGVFWTIGAWEWAGLSGLGHRARLAFTIVFAGLVIVVSTLGSPPAVIDAVLWLAAAAWLIAFATVLRYPPRPAPVLISIFGLVVLSAAWLSILKIHGVGALGPSLILTGLVIVWCADIGAYFAGRRFGHIKLAARVSPKKTWEGVGGGIVLAAVAGAVAAAALGMPIGLLIAVGAAMALISVVGDLSVSLLKRWAGVKDSGVLLPGHGGILDRFDGVTAALPFFALGLQFAHVLD